MYTVEILNKPEYADEYDYIVARLYEAELWFYGAYETKERAEKVALEIDGLVCKVVH